MTGGRTRSRLVRLSDLKTIALQTLGNLCENHVELEIL